VTVAALLAAALLAAPGAPRESLVRLTCEADCSVTVAGQRGRRLTSRRFEFDGVTPGRVRFETEGFAGLPVAAVFLDVQAASEVEVSLSGGRFRVERVRPRAVSAKPPAKGPAGAPSKLFVTCRQPCTVSVDGKRRSGELQVGTLLIGGVPPGRRVIDVRFLAASATRAVDVPAASEVHLSAQDSIVRVTRSLRLE
jgi:hypothetical protein